MGESVLVLESVCKGFARGGRWCPVLEGASLRVGAREVVTVIGTRDQGKTTLVKIAAGILLPDSGSVRIAGLEVGRGLKGRELSEVLREQVGLALRAGPKMDDPVGEYVALRLNSGQGLSRRERRVRVAATLERLDVADCASAEWGEISNWQRARVELAQAIVTAPRLLLVDDVLDGLGLGKSQAAMVLVGELAQEIGCGVLMVASDLMCAEPADRIWRLTGRELRLLADNTTNNIHTLDTRRHQRRAS